MSKKVLITGATGFLGSHLVKALLAEGHQVVILKRSFSDTWRLNDVLEQVISYDIDRCKFSQPFEDIGRIDAVLHTATCYGKNSESPMDLITANVGFPLQLLETAISYKTRVFFNTDTFFNTDSITYSYLNYYALSKKHFLDWSKQLILDHEIKYINAKIFHLYGAGDDNSKFVTSIMKNCIQNIESIDLTLGEQRRDFIYIDDAVSAYLCLLSNLDKLDKKFTEVEVGTSNATTVRSLVESIHKITHSTSSLNFGSIPYRDNEIMYSQANIQVLEKLGWHPYYSLQSGLQLMYKGICL